MFTCSLLLSQFLIWLSLSLWLPSSFISHVNTDIPWPLLPPPHTHTHTHTHTLSLCVLFLFHTWVTDVATPACHHLTTRQGLHHPPHHLLPQATGVHPTRGPTMAEGYVQQQMPQRYVLAMLLQPSLRLLIPGSVTGYYSYFPDVWFVINWLSLYSFFGGVFKTFHFHVIFFSSFIFIVTIFFFTFFSA